MRGLRRGAREAAGVLVEPLAFVLELCMAVADSLRCAVMGTLLLLDDMPDGVPLPYRGAEQGGVLGLLRGASRGAAGVLVQPLAFALETSVAVADSLRSAIMGIPPLLPRARPPRHVAPEEPLAVYNWSEVRAAVCQAYAAMH